MIRALSVALLLALGAPAAATDTPGSTAVAQEKQPQQQAPKRDCEKRQEGVSV